jgi:hypothetical protein
MAAIPAIRPAYAFPPDVKPGFPELLEDAAWEEVALDVEDVLDGGQVISEQGNSRHQCAQNLENALIPT